MLINIDWDKVWQLGRIMEVKDTLVYGWVQRAFKEYHAQLEQKLNDCYRQHLELFHKPLILRKLNLECETYCPHCGARKE